MFRGVGRTFSEVVFKWFFFLGGGGGGGGGGGECPKQQLSTTADWKLHT